MNPLSKILMHLGNKLTLIYYWGDWGKREVIYSPDGKIKIILRVGTLDKFVAWEVWKYREYGKLNINSGDIVLDIGGHIGTFTLLAASKSKTVNVITYEPLPQNFKILKRNVELNNLENVSLNNMAVGSKNGRQQLHVGQENNGSSSFYEADSDDSVFVPVITLESVFKENKLKRVKLLKLDAEGAEYDILLSSSNALLEKIDKIILEYHDYLNSEFNFNDLVNKLSSSGFKVKNNTPFLQKYFMKSGILVAER